MTNNKQDLKIILRPLIKECVKEVILEQGILSHLIKEVVQGMQNSMIVENKQTNAIKPPTTEEYRKSTIQAKQNLEEEKKKLIQDKQKEMERVLKNTGLPAKIFDTIDEKSLPLSSTPTLTESSSKPQFEAKADKEGLALRGIAPQDPGINISGILNIVGGANTWKNKLKK